jgi:orotidine-5'-phosphate decarboxylase
MQPADIAPKDRLIVALDLPGVAEAEALIARLGDSVSFYNIGYQLGYAGGLPLAQQLAKSGKKVFIDLKLHDIGNTVARGVESVAKLGATFLTVHAYPQTMKARSACAGSGLNSRRYRADFVATAICMPRICNVSGWSSRARGECSASTAGQLARRGSRLTQDRRPQMNWYPGYSWLATGDQKRIMTLARAIAAGADYLVVGRPIGRLPTPRRRRMPSG